MKQITIILMMLLLGNSICDAQGFGKAAVSAAKCMPVNKAMVATQVARGYSIQEKQRKQMMQQIITRRIPPVAHINPANLVNVKPIPAAQKVKLPLPTPKLRVINMPDMKALLSVPALDSLSKAIPSDSIIVNKNEDK